MTYEPWMHGYRVTLNHGGPAGVLLRCFSKAKRVYYWRVKLDEGDWVWPERVVCESQGPDLARCTDCHLEFRGEGNIRAALCPNCVKALPHQPDFDADATPAHAFGRRRR